MASPEDFHPDLKILRLTLVRELETINQYQDFYDSARNPALKELMGHLMFEEKEHVAELTEMLKRFDPDQQAHFGGTHAAEIGRREAALLNERPREALAEAAAEEPAQPDPPAPVQAVSPPLVTEIPPPEPAPPAGPVAAISPFTVGSLLGQPQP